MPASRARACRPTSGWPARIRESFFMTREALAIDEIAERLADLPEWQLTEDSAAITKQFIFRNFNAAFGFMTRVALLAEKMDHHPDWRNLYKRVDVTLSTHEVQGLTDLDFDMAARMDKFADS
jgi:4a-hydroxytetrahydrobiopterin dehydratase